MNHEEIPVLIGRLLAALGDLIPRYMADPLDKNISSGNVAVCIIDETGQVYGKIFGQDKTRSRQSFKVAWTKASQVWMTGMKTGEYEKKVFNGQIADGAHGISKPDLIGWEGGQPIVLKDGTKLSVGFSGFRGVSDLDIVARAVASVESA